MSTVTPPAKPPRFRLNPQTARRLKRFRNLKRGYYSFCLLLFLVMMAALGPLLVGNRALAVKYNGRLHFPVLTGFIPGYSNSLLSKGDAAHGKKHRGDHEVVFDDRKRAIEVAKADDKLLLYNFTGFN